MMRARNVASLTPRTWATSFEGEGTPVHGVRSLYPARMDSTPSLRIRANSARGTRALLPMRTTRTSSSPSAVDLPSAFVDSIADADRRRVLRSTRLEPCKIAWITGESVGEGT